MKGNGACIMETHLQWLKGSRCLHWRKIGCKVVDERKLVLAPMETHLQTVDERKLVLAPMETHLQNRGTMEGCLHLDIKTHPGE
jgi:hypothetical protein